MVDGLTFRDAFEVEYLVSVFLLNEMPLENAVDRLKGIFANKGLRTGADAQIWILRQ